ncbi:TATA box-binding protein-like 1 [Ornithodoros turicata]|uniref:TATA box-binding protein-like 1 n=1 Tax=Ornithodoros turicata TaxID=34597 RepID=A0A2R5LLN3_9ACAR
MATVSQGNNFSYHQFSKDVVTAEADGACSKEQATENMTDAIAETDTQNNESSPVIDIVINNVVCSFSVRCHLNLRQIALTASNVEYRRENGMLTMKIRAPYTTASIWSSGKITCTGATSEETAKLAARRYARILQKLGFRVKFHNYRVVNVLGTCVMPFAIKLVPFSQHHRGVAIYEPELHPGVTFRIKDLKATLKVFSTGSITVTAPSVPNVQQAIEQIFPLVYEFRKERSAEEQKTANARRQASKATPVVFANNGGYDSLDSEADEEEEHMDYPESDQSWE